MPACATRLVPNRRPWTVANGARSLPSLALFWGTSVFVVVYWMRVTPQDGQATARTLRKDICRWLYTGGVWAQPDQKRTKFDEADEPFFPFRRVHARRPQCHQGSVPCHSPKSQAFFFQRFRHQVPRFLSGGQSMSSHDVRLIWLEISTGFLLPFPSCDFIFQLTSSRKYPHKWKGMAGMERDYLCERNVNRVFLLRRRFSK